MIGQIILGLIVLNLLTPSIVRNRDIQWTIETGPYTSLVSPKIT